MNYVGHMKGSFKDKNTGKEINYAKLYVTYPHDGVIGLKAEELKCDFNLVPELEKLKVGSKVEVYFDRYQRVQKILVGE